MNCRKILRMKLKEKVVFSPGIIASGARNMPCFLLPRSSPLSSLEDEVWPLAQTLPQKFGAHCQRLGVQRGGNATGGYAVAYASESKTARSALD